MSSLEKKSSQLRESYNLELESIMPIFSSIWAMVSPIDKNSLLYQMSKKEFLSRDMAFIDTFKAFDKSSSQMLHSRYL